MTSEELELNRAQFKAMISKFDLLQAHLELIRKEAANNYAAVTKELAHIRLNQITMKGQ